MVNMTLSIPEDIYKEMMMHSELKWSDIARQAFEKKIKELHWVDQVLKNSKMTEEDAEKIGNGIKAKISKRFLK